MEAIRDNIELAPLHNPANIMGIEACRKIMPGVPNTAVFDTAFHQTMPKGILYAVPMKPMKNTASDVIVSTEHLINMLHCGQPAY